MVMQDESLGANQDSSQKSKEQAGGPAGEPQILIKDPGVRNVQGPLIMATASASQRNCPVEWP